MSNFTPAELEYLASQKLGRLATVGKDGMPHVVPTSFRHNPELGSIDVGGHGLARSRKYADVAREGRAAIVVDDVLPPWRPRGIEIRGRAETVAEGGEAFGHGFDPEVIRIWPVRIRPWGLDEESRPRTVA
jgi:pyridoxamine 5'-phosphate oxidase family protein